MSITLNYGTYGIPVGVIVPVGDIGMDAGWSYWMDWTVAVEKDAK